MKMYYSKHIGRMVTVPEREVELCDKRFLLNLQPVDIDRFVAANGYNERLIEDLQSLEVRESCVYCDNEDEPVEFLRIG